MTSVWDGDKVVPDTHLCGTLSALHRIYVGDDQIRSAMQQYYGDVTCHKSPGIVDTRWRLQQTSMRQQVLVDPLTKCLRLGCTTDGDDAIDTGTVPWVSAIPFSSWDEAIVKRGDCSSGVTANRNPPSIHPPCSCVFAQVAHCRSGIRGSHCRPHMCQVQRHQLFGNKSIVNAHGHEASSCQGCRPFRDLIRSLVARRERAAMHEHYGGSCWPSIAARWKVCI
mmetsp:Transcript_22779/g.52022  ORF Transcript_22779/g.52022 Transcript_22779/m.52022 type:complete len:223 (+) Transcript_22779:224-892(+)